MNPNNTTAVEQKALNERAMRYANGAYTILKSDSVFYSPDVFNINVCMVLQDAFPDTNIDDFKTEGKSLDSLKNSQAKILDRLERYQYAVRLQSSMLLATMMKYRKQRLPH
jgi:hypothetical protein